MTKPRNMSPTMEQGSPHENFHLMKRDHSVYAKDFFEKLPCIHSQNVFSWAGQVFQALVRLEEEEDEQVGVTKKVKSSTSVVSQLKSRGLVKDTDNSTQIPYIEFTDDAEKRETFDLAFSALKYQKLLFALCEDVCFFLINPELLEDYGLVMVMLHDFISRKFQLFNTVGDEIQTEQFQDIAKALVSIRIKLNASLARLRIKHNASTLEHFLPPEIRMKEEASANVLVHAWVNQLKTSIPEIIEELQGEGFQQIGYDDELSGKMFYLDPNCYDLLIFPSEQRKWLTSHSLVEDGHLVLQDKSSCVGSHSVKALLNDGDDFLMVDIGSGITAAHLASLTSPSDTQILACGVKSDQHQKQIMAKLQSLGIRNVRPIVEDFSNIQYDDPRFKHIKIIYMSAECSKSGVTNPVDFIVNEGEDMGILKDLSVSVAQDDNKLSQLVAKHMSMLRHALRFPRVQAVVYATHSIYEAENESVVSRAIEYVNTMQQKKAPYRVAPPVLPLTDADIDTNNTLVGTGKYLRFNPSPLMSGAFVAILTREADDPKEAAKDILARAAAKGLLGGEKVGGLHKDKKKKHKQEVIEEKPAEQQNGHVLTDNEKLEAIRKSFLPTETEPGDKKGSRKGSVVVRRVQSTPQKSMLSYKHFPSSMTRLRNTPSRYLNPRPNVHVKMSVAVEQTTVVRRLQTPHTVTPKLRIVNHHAPFR